jgi:DnaK suppressor protein
MPRTSKAATTATKATKTAKASGDDHPTSSNTATDTVDRGAFLVAQRTLLLDERESYTRHADELKAEADALAFEHEPGDVQFDEEGGEGGTANVDRELDLVLSAQARAAIDEIDRALEKIDAGTYGACERCGQPIPEARLEALPHAALCVACKSGGLSSRR